MGATSRTSGVGHRERRAGLGLGHCSERPARTTARRSAPSAGTRSVYVRGAPLGWWGLPAQRIKVAGPASREPRLHSDLHSIRFRNGASPCTPPRLPRQLRSASPSRCVTHRDVRLCVLFGLTSRGSAVRARHRPFRPTEPWANPHGSVVGCARAVTEEHFVLPNVRSRHLCLNVVVRAG
jgi:hypothetical protein